MSVFNYSAFTYTPNNTELKTLKNGTKLSAAFPMETILLVYFSILIPLSLAPILYLWHFNPLFLIPFFIAISILANRMTKNYRVRLFRLLQFTQDNNLIRETNVPFDNREGITYQRVAPMRFYERYIYTAAPAFETGVYQAGDQSRDGTSLSYIAFKLPCKMPHMIVFSNHNDAARNIGSAFYEIDKTQKISLPGNLNDDFTLYATQENENAALSLFTPQLLQMFTSRLTHFDCEVIDDNVYFSTLLPFDFAAQDFWQMIETFMTQVQPEIANQAQAYQSRSAVQSGTQTMQLQLQKIEQSAPNRLVRRFNTRQLIFTLIGLLIMFLLCFASYWFATKRVGM